MCNTANAIMISIHVLREEDDSGRNFRGRCEHISIHVLREEDDPGLRRRGQPQPDISIHVLREEDDVLSPALLSRRTKFLSTSSARRTTRHTRRGRRPRNISIHVLREEDDLRGD